MERPRKILDIIKEAVAETDDLVRSPEDVAKDLLAREAEFFEGWLTRYIAGRIRTEQRARKILEVSVPGFPNLNRKLRLMDGFVLLRDATVQTLREAAEVVQSEASSKIFGLIEAMQPYEKTRHGFTVGDYQVQLATSPAREALEKTGAHYRPSDVLVLNIIMQHTAHNKSGRATVPTKQFMKEAALSERAVMKSLESLRDKGLIPRGSRGAKRATYWLLNRAEQPTQ